MKKMTWLAVFILLFMVLAACRGDGLEEVEAVLSIDDIILVEGQSHIITYTITPSNLLSHDVDITYLIMDQSPRGYGVISMSDHHLGRQLVAQEAGTATIKAVAVNTLGSDYVFHAETTFTVTVVVAVDEDHEHVRNGGFEQGLQSWTLTSSDESASYDALVVSGDAHSGETVCHLMFAYDETIDGPVTITMSQLLADVPAGTYWFSLWYQGNVFSLTMTVKIGDQVVSTKTFSGEYEEAVPGQNGYVDFGIEVVVETESEVLIEIHVTSDNVYTPYDTWAFLDTVSFIDRILLRGDEYVINGMFDDGLDNWTITSSDPVVQYGAEEYYEVHSGDAALLLSFPYSHDELTITMSQLILKVPAGSYWFSLWYAGNVFSLTMTVKIGEQVVSTETFNGETYDADPEQHYYANFGIEAHLDAESDLTIEIHVIGNNMENLTEFTWAFVDTISFQPLQTGEPVLSIDDITIFEGETADIDYTVTYHGDGPYSVSSIHYYIMSESQDGMLSQSSHSSSILWSHRPGTALIKAVAVISVGSSTIVDYDVETTFTVTVLPLEDEEGEYVINGSFDDGLEAWHIDFSQPYVEYDLDKPANHAHSSEHALFVEFSNHHQSEVPLTFTLSQLIADVPAGTYLFSFWYKGTVFSLTMTVWFESWVVSTYTFSGDNYDDVPGHNGYVNFIIEAYVEVASDLTIEIEIVGNNIEGSEEIWFWSYVDSISFREGFIDESYLMPMGWKED